jgi:polysaccharide export outer membrane protein
MSIGKLLVGTGLIGALLPVLAAAQVSTPTVDAKPPEQQVAVSPAAPLRSADDKEERYRIGYQDTLDVQVFRHPELSRRVNVAPNGTINLFRLDQPIIAVCKTEEELANEIAKAYEKDYLRNPEVSVLAVEQKSQAFSVIGAVEKPGSYYINRRVHLLELLAFAGGPKVDEAGTRLIVARTGSTSNCQAGPATAADNDVQLMDFKIKDVQEGKETLWMKPGDIVSVMDADVVYMYGNVNKQGAVKIKEPLTLTQAISLAEGLRSATKKDKIRVLRQKPGSTEREEIVYDLSKIEKSAASDPFLEPNDIVAVSEDKTKSIINSIGRSLTSGVSTIFYRVPGQ